jgi:DNA-binding NarL/FixJ family response regulator
VPNPFWGGALFPLVVFGFLWAFPSLERRFIGDHAFHNLLDRPRDAQWRTAIGARAVHLGGRARAQARRERGAAGVRTRAGGLKHARPVAKLKDLRSGGSRTPLTDERRAGRIGEPREDKPARRHGRWIRVSVCGAFGAYRDAVARALEACGDFEVVALAGTAAEALTTASRLRPDVVLLETPFHGRLSTLAAVARSAPRAKVVALAVADSDELVGACAEAGVAGYVTTRESLDDLCTTIRRVVHGETVVPARLAAVLLKHVSELATQLSRSNGVDHLTAREREILELIDEGRADKEIAKRLSISVSTVKSHVHNILEKSGTSRRGEAAARLLRD